MRKPVVRLVVHPSLRPAQRRGFFGMIIGVRFPAPSVSIESDGASVTFCYQLQAQHAQIHLTTDPQERREA